MYREMRSRESKTGLLQLLLGLALVVLIVFVIGAIWLSFDHDPKPIVVNKTPTVLPVKPVVETVPSVDNEPLWPDGIRSWTQWEAVATPQMREALLGVAGVTPDQTQRWAAEEQVLGSNFETELPPGTPIVNSGLNGSGWYPVNGYLVKDGDVLFLATDKGIVALKQSCGNPVRPGRKVVQEDKETKTSVKGPNPWPNFIADHQASVPIPGVTFGYVPDRAETVVLQQEDEPLGGMDPTDYGTPGTGSGGVTPPATTTLPDGTVVVTPPPSDDEPAPPPPDATVLPGVVTPEPD
jgi:hypothetical protein